MLTSQPKLIQDYKTPPRTSLARDLSSHHLSPQIDYLRSCRPLSISMGNAIRSLKDTIIKIDPNTPEDEAKAHLCDTIDNFLREHIVAADALIAEQAAKKIRNGDIILTYAKSSLVLKTLMRAHEDGTRFRVVVVDSKPLFEGRKLATDLAAAGIEVTYGLISAASHAMQEATQVFLGAAAMMGNGRLYSRVGTAIVAMLAHEAGIPVIVCCESIKFTDRVALDSIVSNEVAPAEELLLEGEDGGKSREKTVDKWTDTPNLQILNIMHDVTPAEYVQLVVTEYGSLPPSSVPAVLRILETKG
jgi:translation initiation factor eIF-2B subunit delta